MTRRGTLTLAAVFVAAMVLIAVIGPLVYADECTFEHGVFLSRMVAGPACDGVLCTKGFLLGTLKGIHRFTLTENLGVPPVVPFAGESHFKTTEGEFFGADEGTMNLKTGELITQTTIVTDTGTGAFINASGTIAASAAVDFALGTVRGTYAGEICTP